MHKLYVICLSGVFALLIGALVFVSTYLQPFSGDLTRIGGLAETKFGWNQPQQNFAKSRFELSFELKPFPTGPWDIVVFGDSFTDNGRASASWLDYVSGDNDRTLALRYKSVQQIYDYLNSPAFISHPPRLLIIESVTRNMAYAVARPDCTGTPGKRPAIAPRFNPPSATTTIQTRDARFTNLKERLNVASYSLRQQLVFRLAPSLSPVRRYKLNRRDLFSSNEPETLLYYASDTEGQNVSEEQVAKLTCTVIELSRLATRTGKTTFFFLPAPDKSVAYAGQSSSNPFVAPEAYTELKAALGSEFVDTLPPLQAAIARGEKDVYLPNDSHWGYRGAEIAARTLMEAGR